MESSDKSDFNDAYSHFRRINYHLVLANLAHSEYDYFNWFQNLVIVWKEIQPLVIDKDEREKVNTLRTQIKILINKEIHKNTLNPQINKYSKQLIDSIDELDTLIRDNHKKTGLLYKERFDPLKPEK